MKIPTLKSANLILRPFDERDVGEMHQVLTGKDVLRYFPSDSPPSQQRVERMIHNLLNHWEEHGYGLWAVESQAEQKLIGRCGLQYLPETAEVEVDFILGNNYWGRGFATEAGKTSVRYGLEELGIQAIVGIVHIDNFASQRVLEKIGMRLVEAKEYFGMPCYRYLIERR